ncbi:hypothetical protein GCM10007859_25030 [Brevundimonas denitrificans]|uniref:Uncharacterized protein n=2 Tax=Brevundimonas denitrificans TaxID=1443434 RepID=A0ABQ6BM05_9CAUL|nr:hypothetical protein GCM10007859_25030 [Brevundimonas denitrificans]
MSRAMTRSLDRADSWLLDEEVWDSPGRLTDADLFAHASPGWRRGDAPLDDPEDDR